MALLQETQPPEWALEHWPALQHSPTCARSPWGAAILSKTVPLDTVEPSTPWLRKLRGKVQIARLAGAHPLWLASIHSNAYPLKPEECQRRLKIDPPAAGES